MNEFSSRLPICSNFYKIKIEYKTLFNIVQVGKRITKMISELWRNGTINRSPDSLPGQGEDESNIGGKRIGVVGSCRTFTGLWKVIMAVSMLYQSVKSKVKARCCLI